MPICIVFRNGRIRSLSHVHPDLAVSTILGMLFLGADGVGWLKVEWGESHAASNLDALASQVALRTKDPGRSQESCRPNVGLQITNS